MCQVVCPILAAAQMYHVIDNMKEKKNEFPVFRVDCIKEKSSKMFQREEWKSVSMCRCSVEYATVQHEGERHIQAAK